MPTTYNYLDYDGLKAVSDQMRHIHGNIPISASIAALMKIKPSKNWGLGLISCTQTSGATQGSTNILIRANDTTVSPDNVTANTACSRGLFELRLNCPYLFLNSGDVCVVYRLPTGTDYSVELIAIYTNVYIMAPSFRTTPAQGVAYEVKYSFI